MPQNQPKLQAAQPIVLPDMTMEQLFRTWVLLISDNVPIVATGDPEGVVEAPQYTLYIDEATPTVPVQYRKMLPSIANDRKQGWIQV